MKKIIAVIAVLIAAAVVYFHVMEKKFYNNFVKRAMEIRELNGPWKVRVITKADLLGLPEPVKKYMMYSGVLNKKPIKNVHLKHAGEFKPGEKAPWMPIKGEYYITSRKPSFSWYGKVTAFPGMWIAAADSCFMGKGRMTVKFMSVFPIADAAGPDIDKSAFGRLIAEMTMCPSVFLDKNIVKWEPVDSRTAKLVFTDSWFSAPATVFFNADGSLDKIQLMRYYSEGKESRPEIFEGRGLEPKEFNGYKIPSYFIGTWKLKTGDLEYVRFRVENAEYE